VTEATDLRVHVSNSIGEVSAFLLRPPQAWVLYVLAHGAGAGMRHAFLDNVCAALASQGVATFRYQFPYLESGRRRPDPSTVLETTVRAAVSKAGEIVPELPVIAGGKSLGGRMTSAAAASQPLGGVKGLVFLGFPLHPPGQPGTRRADHLDRVDLPMLFLQGTRDAFARLDLITGVCRNLGQRASLHLLDGADHSFALSKRAARTSSHVMEWLAGTVVSWSRSLLEGAART
jgi:predicted alpha/beta-hydrolase family hydrolase